YNSCQSTIRIRLSPDQIIGCHSDRREESAFRLSSGNSSSGKQIPRYARDDESSAARKARGSIRHFKLNDDWSTITPGPIVELTEIFCRYWPLEVAGLALTRSASNAVRFSFRRSDSK